MQNGKTEPFEDKITIVKIKTMAIVHELEKNQTIFVCDLMSMCRKKVSMKQMNKIMNKAAD